MTDRNPSEPTLSHFATSDEESDLGPEPDPDPDSESDPQAADGPSPADTDTDKLYDPTDEWDELTDTSLAGGIDGGRRANLDAVRNKSSLSMLDLDENFDSITQLVNRLRELSLVRKDGAVQRSIPEAEIETIRGIFDALPDEAKQHFVNDDELRRRINTARRRFNEWMAGFERKEQMPGWTEAGPAKYNSDKFSRLSDSERSQRSEIDEAIDRVRAGANGGARQRALAEIGSSVAEQTANQDRSQREQMRDQLESGMIVTYRSPREQVGAVIRVNTKTATISRPNPRHPGDCPLTGDPEDPYITTRQDLDSEWLTPVTEATFADVRDECQEIPETDTYESAAKRLNKTTSKLTPRDS